MTSNYISRCGQLRLADSLAGMVKITLSGCFAIAFSGNYALAQITPDNTLGPENSVVVPIDQINSH